MRWTPEEDAVLRRAWGERNPAWIRRRLKQMGYERTVTAVQIRAGKLKLHYRDNLTDFTVQQVAAWLGVAPGLVHDRIRHGRIRIRRRTSSDGRLLRISPEEFERLQGEFPPPPKRWIGRTAFMRRMGYSDTHSSQLLRAGVVRGVKRGGRWFVDLDDVERLEAELRRTGRVKLDLTSYSTMDEDRRKARDYARQRRKRDREKAGVAPSFSELLGEALTLAGVGFPDLATVPRKENA